MKKAIKSASLFLAIALLFTLLPGAAFAAEPVLPDNLTDLLDMDIYGWGSWGEESLNSPVEVNGIMMCGGLSVEAGSAEWFIDLYGEYDDFYCAIVFEGSGYRSIQFDADNGSTHTEYLNGTHYVHIDLRDAASLNVYFDIGTWDDATVVGYFVKAAELPVPPGNITDLLDMDIYGWGSWGAGGPNNPIEVNGILMYDGFTVAAGSAEWFIDLHGEYDDFYCAIVFEGSGYRSIQFDADNGSTHTEYLNGTHYVHIDLRDAASLNVYFDIGTWDTATVVGYFINN